MKKSKLLIVVSIIIALAVAYFFVLPKGREVNFHESHVVTIEFHGGTALTPFRGVFYHMGGRTMIDYDPNQSSINLRGGDLLSIKLLGYPSNVTSYYLQENHLFLIEQGGNGMVEGKRVTLIFLIGFVVPYDGVYSFDLGVIDTPYYDYKNSKGLWMFEVTITSS